MHSINILKERIENLSEYTQELMEIRPEVVYEKGPWTALKDAFLLSYIRNVYVPIISRYYDKYYYLDFCAGPGLVKIENDIVLGSPIVAAIAPAKPFTKMFLLEKDVERARVLEERMKRIKEFPEFQNIDFEVIKGDCNITINKVMEEMKSKRGTHHRLAFFDPEGMEINYDTFANCLSMYTDMIYNFQTPGIYREIASAYNLPERDRKRLCMMFGDSDSWKNCGTREETLMVFEQLLRNTYYNTIKPQKPITRTVQIHSGESYVYHLIFLTRKTYGESPWMRSVDRLKKETEENTGKLVKHALDVFKGRMTDLTMFMTDEEIKKS